MTLKSLSIPAKTLAVAIAAGAVLACIAKVGGWTPDLTNTLWGAGIGGIGGAVITGVVGVLLRGSIDHQLAEKGAALSRENAEKLANLQAKLTEDQAHKKADIDERVQKAIERERVEIQRDVENHKHELARAVEISKLQTAKLHVVLPELWDKVMFAKAPLPQWFGGYRNDFAQIPVIDAKKAVDTAHNFRILNDLFLPSDVSSHASEVLKAIEMALTAAEFRETKGMYEKGCGYDKKASEQAEALRIAMRRALGNEPVDDKSDRADSGIIA